MRRFYSVAVVCAVFLIVLVACGGTVGEAPPLEEGPLEIERAEWISEEGRVSAEVRGTWPYGISTPPICVLFADGERSEWPDDGSRTSPDGDTFTKVFASTEGSTLDPLPEYRVRCSVNLSTGRTLAATAPVSGEIPGA